MTELKRVMGQHLERYPQLTLQDAVKLIYQNEFGCGHFISDEMASLERLAEEVNSLTGSTGELFEDIGNGYVRLQLGALGDSLSLQTVNRFFVLTAAKEGGSRESFEEKLSLLNEFFPRVHVSAFLEKYKEAGYPPMSHSSVYRECYSPSYRVVNRVFAQYYPVFERIDQLMTNQRSTSVVAIDGRSGSGKSSLGQLLQDVYGCPLISMDDFFLRPEQRGDARLQEPGGNIDYERFELEVKPHLKAGLPFEYKAYDCQRNELAASQTIHPHRLMVVEGCYSHHPRLADIYDLRVFLTVSPDVQRERILARSGPHLLERFIKEWIPLEELYFTALDIPNQSDVIVDTELQKGTL